MSRSSTTGSGCTRPWATAPRPRPGPAWKGSACVQPRDVLIPSLHSAGGSPGEAVHLAQELADERGGRVVVDLRRPTHLLDPARPHDDDPVGELERLLLV